MCRRRDRLHIRRRCTCSCTQGMAARIADIADSLGDPASFQQDAFVDRVHPHPVAGATGIRSPRVQIRRLAGQSAPYTSDGWQWLTSDEGNPAAATKLYCQNSRIRRLRFTALFDILHPPRGQMQIRRCSPSVLRTTAHWPQRPVQAGNSRLRGNRLLAWIIAMANGTRQRVAASYASSQLEHRRGREEERSICRSCSHGVGRAA